MDKSSRNRLEAMPPLMKMLNHAKSVPRIGNPTVKIDGLTGEKLLAIFPPTKVFQERVRTLWGDLQKHAQGQTGRGKDKQGTSAKQALPQSISSEIDAILNEFEDLYPTIVHMLRSL